MFKQLVNTIKTAGNTYTRVLSGGPIRNIIYTNEYEWHHKDNNDSNDRVIYKIGITHKALEEFNEIVYIEPLYNIGDIVDAGVELCVIESVKASDSLDAPFDCEVIDINEILDDCLDSINDSPECEETAWFVKIKKID